MHEVTDFLGGALLLIYAEIMFVTLCARIRVSLMLLSNFMALGLVSENTTSPLLLAIGASMLGVSLQIRSAGREVHIEDYCNDHASCLEDGMPALGPS